jgi:hypothetical protein
MPGSLTLPAGKGNKFNAVHPRAEDGENRSPSSTGPNASPTHALRDPVRVQRRYAGGFFATSCQSTPSDSINGATHSATETHLGIDMISFGNHW